MNSFLKVQQSRKASSGDKTARPELLCPAGCEQSVYAAVENGCSAIYAGLTEFSARKNANNFTVPELERVVDYCHLRGVKLFVTANTLVKDCEINRFLGVVESIYLIGADGIIVQDIGCASLINKYFPDFYLSASTQMTIHDANGAEFLRKQGFSRVILSRELSETEIAHICANTDADIECFIHGALCVSYSGQCLLSAFNGGRSGNRGECAQPCRLNYRLHTDNMEIATGGILSPKDAMGLYALPKLIESGVSSFKIEGRMKSPEYVAVTASVYRKHLDLYFDAPDSYSVDEADILKLAAVFNRSGFNRGYFNDYSGRHMLTETKVGNTGVYIGEIDSIKNQTAYFKTLYAVSPGDGIEILNKGTYIAQSRKQGEIVAVTLKEKAKPGAPVFRTYDKKLTDELRASYSRSKRKLEVDGLFIAKSNKQISFCAEYGGCAATAFACIPEKAVNSAVTPEMVRKQLTKTGDTPFVIKNLKIEMDEGLFINVSELNRIRRETLQILENKIITKYKRNKRSLESSFSINATSGRGEKSEFTVLVRTAGQLEAVKNYSFSRLYVDFSADNHELEHFRKKGTKIYKCLSHIQRDLEQIKQNDIFDNDLFDGYLARTYGQIEQINGRFDYAVDYTLNTFNSISAAFWTDKKCKSVCISLELNTSEIGKCERAEAVKYGKIALMTTVQCPIGNFYGKKTNMPFCKNKGKSDGFVITSKKSYDLMPVCDKCYCILRDTTPVRIMTRLDVKYQRIEFTNEKFIDARKIMSTLIE